MLSNGLNKHLLTLAVIIISASLINAVASNDEQYSWGYYWDENTHLGKCYESIKSYISTVYSADGYENDIEASKPKGDKSKLYYLLRDMSPSRNQPWILFRKEASAKYCIIMLQPGAEGIGASLTINKDGSLPDELEALSSPSGFSPSIRMKYLYNKSRGFYEPNKCTWEWLFDKEWIARTTKIPCDNALDPPSWNALNSSLDCSKVNTGIEKSICDDTKLIALDYTLSNNYNLIESAATDAQNTQLTSEQKEWLKQRNACRDNGCIVNAYRNRIDELCTKYAVSLPRPFDCVRSGDIQFTK
jgi:uncharacterized protein YecT (DUF1311 family)